ncbi:hypothetical protein ACF5W4_08240 [Bacillota bacterium Lsc_1132]
MADFKLRNDVATILGTCLMLLGATYGYVLKWGLIIWSIIGAVPSLLLGFLIKLLMVKKRRTGTGKITSEVILMIRCKDHQWETIEKILWDNLALGVAKVR